MKTYELWLHYKAGDDFYGFLEDNKNDISAALAGWGEHFKHCTYVCQKLSGALKGYNIDVQADTHNITFAPNDEKAEHLLDALVKEGLLSAYEWDDEEKEFIDEGEEVDG